MTCVVAYRAKIKREQKKQKAHEALHLVTSHGLLYKYECFASIRKCFSMFSHQNHICEYNS